MILQTQLYVGNANRILTPIFIQRKYNAFASTTSFSVTLDASPTEGNFLVIVTGGSQNRTATMPGGYSTVNLTGGGPCNWIGYKTAGAGESATVTVTWDLALQGSLGVYEFANVDSIAPVISGTGLPGTDFTTQTSVQYTTFEVPMPSVYIAALALGASLSWNIDSGYTTPTATSRYFPSYKVYDNPDPAEAPTWSGGSGSGNYGLIGFMGRRI